MDTATYLARQPVFDPAHLTRLFVLGLPLGWLEAPTARFLARLDPAFVPLGEAGMTLTAETARQAEALLARATLAMRENGLVRGWRNERYTVFVPGADGAPDLHQPLFALERAAFRRFGFTSRAVHVNGYTAEGALWIGRRAASKSIDPNRLDNLAAGGLPEQEDEFACVIRELAEEAGVPEHLARQAIKTDTLRVTRNEADGTHDEWLYGYDLLLPDDFTPHNTDGEVAGFMPLSRDAVIARLEDFTWDAGVITCGWLQRHGD
ncbi:MAG TPA: DUF4743 domain-containing protein [Chitinolyticbacter sp.]|nr:DUF4743 domain-containing protein [Chitinolyticbacter sp.]